MKNTLALVLMVLGIVGCANNTKAYKQFCEPPNWKLLGNVKNDLRLNSCDFMESIYLNSIEYKCLEQIPYIPNEELTLYHFLTYGSSTRWDSARNDACQIKSLGVEAWLVSQCESSGTNPNLNNAKKYKLIDFSVEPHRSTLYIASLDKGYKLGTWLEYKNEVLVASVGCMWADEDNKKVFKLFNSKDISW